MLGGGGGDRANRAAVGYLLSETEIGVANSAGAALGTFRGSASFDLRGSLLVANAGSRADGLVRDDGSGIRGYDITSGQELFHVTSGVYPTILDERGRVALWIVAPTHPPGNAQSHRPQHGPTRQVDQ
jgi:hypothetical protein